MSKRCGLWFLLFVFSLCSGCRRSSEEERDTFYEQAIVNYDVEDLSTYADNEEGNLYVSSANEETAELKKFDDTGKQVFCKTVQEAKCVCQMTAGGGKVYFVSAGHNDNGLCFILYSFDEEKNIVEKLYEFEEYSGIKQILYAGERIYVLGYQNYVQESVYQEGYISKGEQLVFYSMKDRRIYEMNIKEPISIATKGEESLVIQAYLKEKGFCILEYLPNRDQLESIATYKQQKFDLFAISDTGNSVIYTYDVNSRGIVLSHFDDLDVESELCEMPVSSRVQIYCIKNQVYAIDSMTSKPFRFQLANDIQTEKAIHYISPGFQEQEPYGCGYAMYREEMDYDKFVLKVMARDSDYDLCLIDSANDYSYNIRKNGVFYPLNHLKGMEEYLNQCYPYVLEAATNVQGDIWMMPIGVDIHGFAVNEKIMSQNQIDFTQDLTLEQFTEQMRHVIKKDGLRYSCNSYVVRKACMDQYFEQETSIDTAKFRLQLNYQQKLFQILPQMIDTFDYNETDFLFTYCIGQKDYQRIHQRDMDMNTVKICGMPKLMDTEKNIGSCVFLAVNPSSKNLKQTLCYLETYLNYFMKKEEKPLYFQDKNQKQDKYMQSLEHLYKNGEIAFSVDQDLYEDDLDLVLDGTKNMEDYIKESERKINIYFRE